MKSATWRVVVAGVVVSTMTGAAYAATGTWTNTTGGTQFWGTGANWQSGTIPNGVGDSANLTANIIADTFIDIDSVNPTVGQILIDDPGASHNYRIDNGNLTFNNSALDATLTVNTMRSRTNVINSNVAVTLAGTGNLSVTNNSGFGIILGGGIAGSGNITANGPTEIVLSGINTYAGNTFVTAGQLTSQRDFGAMPSTTNAIISPGAEYRALDVSVFNGLHGSGLVRVSAGGQIDLGTYGGYVGDAIILASGGEIRPGDLNPASPGSVGTLSLSLSTSPFRTFRTKTGGDIFLDFASLSSYDKINVVRTFEDSLIMGGNLNLNFLGGYTPAVGDTFDIIVGATLTQFVDPNGGTLFDTITHNLGLVDFKTEIIQGSSDLIRLTLLPEPTGAAILLVAALGLVRRRRI